MSDLFADAILSTFDSNTRLHWNLTSANDATASFDFDGDRVTVTFHETHTSEWRVSFEIASTQAFSAEKAAASFRLFSGIFRQ